MKNYEQEFKQYLLEVKELGYGTVSSYISTITSYIDNLIAKRDSEHTSILHTVDTELLELYYLFLKEDKDSKVINLSRYRNALSTLNTYIKFSKYYSKNIHPKQDKEVNNNLTHTSSIIKKGEEEQLDRYKSIYIETPSLEETATITEKNDKQSDNTPNIEDIEKEIATLSKWNLPIPKELLDAREFAKAAEKKKKQRLLKNNIEYSLNNILTQIPISMKYNISYTKENGFIIDFYE